MVSSLISHQEGRKNPGLSNRGERPVVKGWACWSSSVTAIPQFKNLTAVDFPGGPVVNNPPANAGDTGLIHDLRRFYMLWGN